MGSFDVLLNDARTRFEAFAEEYRSAHPSAMMMDSAADGGGGATAWVRRTRWSAGLATLLAACRCRAARERGRADAGIGWTAHLTV
jgi:hypothetical protein